MTNHDNTRYAELAQRISDAATNGNKEAFEGGLQDMFSSIENDIKAQASEMEANATSAALAQRGVRVLTAQETSFYNNLISAMQSNNGDLKMALTDVDKTLPLTIVTQVMEDMKQNHPLLAAVDTVNATGVMRFIINADAGENATWNALESEITKEIASAFKVIDLGQFKLSAFMPVSQDMLSLGATWLDSYIRTCLSEALAIGYEKAIVTGTGKNQPIGMDRSVADDVTVVGGEYPQKTAVAVTDFKPATYGNLISQLAKTQEGKARAVDGLILVVNPTDYYKLVLPATTVMTPNGGYVNGVLPYPTEIIQSVAVASGEAILGMGKKYFLGIGGKRGIQFSDDYKFVEDNRYYKIVAYGNGRPKDNNAFLRLDISALKSLAYPVENA